VYPTAIFDAIEALPISFSASFSPGAFQVLVILSSSTRPWTFVLPSLRYCTIHPPAVTIPPSAPRCGKFERPYPHNLPTPSSSRPVPSSACLRVFPRWSAEVAVRRPSSQSPLPTAILSSGQSSQCPRSWSPVVVVVYRTLPLLS